ncbi:MAG TPA: tetratricopeptide repeat protein, partial [Polyangiaceae bacterium]|nr:tetratricopeptide repeat protein [Polyangiaceae bacterium]
NVEDDVSSLRMFRTLSTVGFIAGGVLAGTGVVLLLTSRSKTEQARRAPSTLALGVGPGDVRLEGSF